MVPGSFSRGPVRGIPGQCQLRALSKLLCFAMTCDTYLRHSHTKWCFFLILAGKTQYNINFFLSNLILVAMGAETGISKTTILVMNRVLMAPHRTILCHNEAQHLHEAF